LRENAIRQFLNDSWYDTLEQSGEFIYTEAAQGYLELFNTNLASEIGNIYDTHFKLTPEEQTERLLYHNFQCVRQVGDYQVFYRSGRLITKMGSRLNMIYQYKGVPPGLLTKTETLRLDYDVFADTLYQSTAMVSINEYMEENGEFIEPWKLARFNNKIREILADLVEEIPENLSKKLFSV